MALVLVPPPRAVARPARAPRRGAGLRRAGDRGGHETVGLRRAPARHLPLARRARSPRRRRSPSRGPTTSRSACARSSTRDAGRQGRERVGDSPSPASWRRAPPSWPSSRRARPPRVSGARAASGRVRSGERPRAPRRPRAARSTTRGSKAWRSGPESADRDPPDGHPERTQTEDEAVDGRIRDAGLPEPGESFPAIWRADAASAPPVRHGLRQGVQLAQESRATGATGTTRACDLHHGGNYEEGDRGLREGDRGRLSRGRGELQHRVRLCPARQQGQGLRVAAQAPMDEGFELVGVPEERRRPRRASTTIRAGPRSRAVARDQKSTKRRPRRAAPRRATSTSSRGIPKSGEPYFDMGRELLSADRLRPGGEGLPGLGRRAATASRTSLYNEACALSSRRQEGPRRSTCSARRSTRGSTSPTSSTRTTTSTTCAATRASRRSPTKPRSSRCRATPTDRGTARSRSNRARWRDAAKRFPAYADKHPQSAAPGTTPASLCSPATGRRGRGAVPEGARPRLPQADDDVQPRLHLLAARPEGRRVRLALQGARRRLRRDVDAAASTTTSTTCAATAATARRSRSRGRGTARPRRTRGGPADRSGGLRPPAARRRSRSSGSSRSASRSAGHATLRRLAAVPPDDLAARPSLAARRSPQRATGVEGRRRRPRRRSRRGRARRRSPGSGRRARRSSRPSQGHVREQHDGGVALPPARPRSRHEATRPDRSRVDVHDESDRQRRRRAPARTLSASWPRTTMTGSRPASSRRARRPRHEGLAIETQEQLVRAHARRGAALRG